MSRLSAQMIGRRSVACLSLVFLIAVAIGEHDIAGTLFVVTVAAFLIALVIALVPRPLFAVVSVGVLLTVVTAVSAAKMRFMGVSLHAFDAFFYLQDTGNAAFLLGGFLLPIIGIAVLLGACILFAWLVYRRDETSRSARLLAAGALLPLFGLTALAYPRETSDRLERYYFGYHLTSSLFVSLRDVGSLFGEPGFVRRLARIPPSGTYPDPESCGDAAARPDIVVALMESAFPPSLYPGISAPKGLDAEFRTADGRLRSLQVETFAGGTWITTAGFVTGLPTTEFGWMRPYLPYYLNGRIHNSLIRAAERCGYETMFLTPLSYGFVNEGPFLSSVGFRTSLDWKSIGAGSKHERDSVYFDAALKRIRGHRAASAKPLFVYVMTMAAHGPYDYRFAPEERIAGEPFGNDPQLDEYLRRLELQRRDFDAFAAALAAEPGRNGTILVDFGDHQPMVTRAAAESVDPLAVEHWESVAYRTYYRIVGLGRELARPLPDVDTLSIQFLGVTVLEAAGIPLDASHRELVALRDVCGGRLDTCPDRNRIFRHLKKLVASRMLDFGPSAR